MAEHGLEDIGGRSRRDGGGDEGVRSEVCRLKVLGLSLRWGGNECQEVTGGRVRVDAGRRDGWLEWSGVPYTDRLRRHRRGGGETERRRNHKEPALSVWRW